MGNLIPAKHQHANMFSCSPNLVLCIFQVSVDHATTA